MPVLTNRDADIGMAMLLSTDVTIPKLNSDDLKD